MSVLDPIELRVITGALHAACEEMGVVLIRSAHSANIKERRDASTALFNAGGEMIMQAEHIPVHLGAMPAAVAAVVDQEHAPGESWVLNDPFAGGTHLPDITLVAPVYVDRDRTENSQRLNLLEKSFKEGHDFSRAVQEKKIKLMSKSLLVPQIDTAKAVLLPKSRKPDFYVASRAHG